MEAIILFIGTVHSPLKSMDNCPLQENENAPEATIIIRQEFIDGIKDIKEGSEILLFTWLHKADRTVLKCRPRNNAAAPLTGVFSTRSPDRPNPMGMHAVKVISIKQDVIKVSGLEVLDQTPLIDIKPVLKKDR